MAGSQFVSVFVLTVGLVVCECAQIPAADLYVAPTGTSSGNGTVTKPYDLMSALSGSVGEPGDTFWLREGSYPIGAAYTEIHGASGRPITFRPALGERARLIGSLTIGGSEGHLIFRDLELCSGVEERMSRVAGMGFKPPDLTNFVEGFQVGAPNLSFINLVVHDAVRSGFYTAAEATNVLIYGCLVYNSGWASPDNAEGHSYYLQAPGEISDNIGGNSTGAGFHIYASSTGAVLENMRIVGNVAWGAGALQNVRSYRDWLVGVDAPALRTDNMFLAGNMGYVTTNATTLRPVQLGREGANGGLVLISNYWPQGLEMNNWSNAVVVGNTVALQTPNDRIHLDQNLTPLRACWNSNYYAVPSGDHPFRVGSKSYSFGEWTNATGCDPVSSFSTGPLKGTKIFVRPNRYEPGRANIIVYNWDNLPQVAVNVGEIVPKGAAYEVRNAQDFYSAPVLSGTFNGQPLMLPMNGLTVAKPMAALRTPPPTGPTFNVFILLSHVKEDH